MTRRADEMKVTWVPERRLEARAAVTEVDLAGDPGADHPLQGAIDGGAADASRFAADMLEQIVGTDMAFLPQEDIQHPIAFAGALTAGGDRGNW